MALQLPWDAYGVTFPAAYARVETVRARTSGDAFADLAVYTDDTKQHLVANVSARFPLDKGGPNVHTQAYNAAKLLPELAGAVDV